MLILKNFSSGYNEKTVLKSFSLEAKVGKAYAIVGPGNSGKSTLLKFLAKRTTDEKDFWFKGTHLNEYEHLVYLPQNIHLQSPVYANPGSVDIWNNAGIRKLFMELETDKELDPAVRKLKALTQHLSDLKEGSLILLDEPEVKIGKYYNSLVALINRLKRKHCIIIVTHNVDFMLKVSNFICYVSYGKVIKADTKFRFLNIPDVEVDHLLKMGV